MKKISKKMNTEQMNAMLKALGQTGGFEFDADHDKNTVVVTHPKFGEVLRGKRAADEDVWTVQHNEDLFK